MIIFMADLALMFVFLELDGLPRYCGNTLQFLKAGFEYLLFFFLQLVI
jgi:hypothetical protein